VKARPVKARPVKARPGTAMAQPIAVEASRQRVDL
jgi:hypothetical protein